MIGALRPYAGLAAAAWRSVQAYRATFVLGLLMLVFNLLAMLALWRVLLHQGRSLSGFDWPHMKAYLLIVFVANCLVSTYSDYTMALRIQSGLVALDLTKPIDYQAARFAETLGRVALELLTAAAVTVAALLAFGGLPVPGPAQLLLFVVSLAAVVPLKFLIVYLSGLVCFWTQDYVGVNWARVAVSALMSGTLIPLAFLPGWLRDLAFALPFQGTASAPALLFIGQVTGPRAVGLVAGQLAWTVALWFGTRWAWRSALRQLTVHGG